jgi:hypothetical protein
MFLFKRYLGEKNHKYNPQIDEVCRFILENDPIEVIKESPYREKYVYNDITINMWTANKWYAFMSHGSVVLNKNNKKIFSWSYEMPSRKMIYLMRKRLPEITKKVLNNKK